MKIWIVGTQGLLAKALFLFFQKKNISAICSSREEVDLRDPLSLYRFFQGKEISHIINCAAITNVDQAEIEKSSAFCVNAEGPSHLATLAKEKGAHLLQISTDYVFGGEERQIPYLEESPTAPVNYYGKTKLEGEKSIQKILPSACILRTSWLFGKGKDNFVLRILHSLKQNHQICIPIDHWGTPTYVPDLCEAIAALLDKSGLYHFSNEGPTNRYEFGLTIQKLHKATRGFPENIQPARLSDFASPAKRPHYSVLDLTKISSIMTPRPWQAALQDYLHEIS